MSNMSDETRAELIAANQERSRRESERRRTAEEVRGLRQTHRGREQVRHAFSLAETGLMGPGFALSQWAGYDRWMEMTSQDQRDAQGPKALAQLDEAIGAFMAVRAQLVAELGDQAEPAAPLGDGYLPGGRFEHEAPRYFVVDILREKDTYFVLDSALRDWESRERSDAQFELDSDPDDTTAARRIEWADAAAQLLKRLDRALDSRSPAVRSEGQGS